VLPLLLKLNSFPHKGGKNSFRDACGLNDYLVKLILVKGEFKVKLLCLDVLMGKLVFFFWLQWESEFNNKLESKNHIRK